MLWEAISHWKECFIRYPDTLKLVKETRLRLVFSSNFLMFGYLIKHSISSLSLTYYIKVNSFVALWADQLETSSFPPSSKPRAFWIFEDWTVKIPAPAAKMSDLSIKCPPPQGQSSSVPVVLKKAWAKHADTCFLILYIMMPYLPDLSHFKKTTLILKLLKITLSWIN